MQLISSSRCIKSELGQGKDWGNCCSDFCANLPSQHWLTIHNCEFKDKEQVKADSWNG